MLILVITAACIPIAAILSIWSAIRGTSPFDPTCARQQSAASPQRGSLLLRALPAIA
jgi:hypothetical protein